MSFVSTRSSMLSEAKSMGRQYSLFPVGPVTKCFVIPLNSKKKKEKKAKINLLLDAGCLTNLPRFQRARPDHVRVESSSVVSLGSEWVLFALRSQWVLTHTFGSPPIRKRIWVGIATWNDHIPPISFSNVLVVIRFLFRITVTVIDRLSVSKFLRDLGGWI